jgi:phosphoglycolate phosphatase
MARLWLFDFDGTLVNSEKAIKACYLEVGKELVPERCTFIKTMVIGPTLHESIKMILDNKKLHLLDVFKKKFQQLYDDKLVFETPRYPLVDETLKQLRNQGDHLCVVTNKRAHPTHKLIEHYSWHQLFEWVACMDEYPSAQNKSDIITLKNISKKKYDVIFFVGDTLSDGITAQAHNIPFIWAQYGYGQNQDWSKIKIFKTINSIDEIKSIN